MSRSARSRSMLGRFGCTPRWKDRAPANCRGSCSRFGLSIASCSASAFVRQTFVASMVCHGRLNMHCWPHNMTLNSHPALLPVSLSRYVLQIQSKQPLTHLRAASVGFAYLPGARRVTTRRKQQPCSVHACSAEPGDMRLWQVAPNASRESYPGLLVAVQLVSPQCLRACATASRSQQACIYQDQYGNTAAASAVNYGLLGSNSWAMHRHSKAGNILTSTSQHAHQRPPIRIHKIINDERECDSIEPCTQPCKQCWPRLSYGGI